MAATWEDTKLWKTLSQRESGNAKSVNATLRLAMPKIEVVLRHGATAPLTFTLHDDGHSFRVAERMVEVVTPTLLEKLSTYELALLLLAAYLHDIGMTPEQQLVKRHYQFLLTGATDGLSQSAREEFLRWLDAEGRGAAVPLDQRGPASEVQPLAEELIAYYARHKHNDWSKVWIETHLQQFELGGYVHWREDLITLCQSHHWGYRELRSDVFDPRPVGMPPQMVHLRFLAAVLRVADILEFDPERTPPIVFRHRLVSEKSAIYWWKDHHITLQIGRERQLEMFASPPNAYIHRAIDVMIDDIEEELRLCRRLDDETHFDRYPGRGGDLPHRWTLLPYVHRHITPKGYEYIDGAFRPDTQKLLELFSGTALYGNKLTALRELLQNAFDAVRQQIALERLVERNPADPEWELKLGDRHRVTLTLDTSTEPARLTCTDTGIGMTKAIIRDRLLVSGSAKRQDILALERRAKEAGFPLELSGQFGIGVLSYFMLADQVTIRTRRSQQSEDAEASGWSFHTSGVGSFGELRSERELPRGTTVEFRLRPPQQERSWSWDIRRYLRDTLQWVPCHVEFGSNEADARPLRLRPGWVEAATGVMRMAETSGTFREQDFAGELPDRTGRYLLHLGYIEMPGGVSLASLRLEAEGDRFRIARFSKAFCDFLHAREPLISWRGFKVGLGSYRTFNAPVHVRVDFRSPEAGQISVDRGRFNFNDQVESRMYDFVGREITTALRRFVRAHSSSLYAALNYRVAGIDPPRNKGLHWVVPIADEGKEQAEWRRLEFPAACFLNESLPSVPPAPLQWKGLQVSEVFPLPNSSWEHRVEPVPLLPWDMFSFPPDRVVLCSQSRPSLAALWEEPSTPKKKAGGMRPAARYAPGWQDLCGAWFYGTNHIIWNAEHPLVQLTTSESWETTSRRRNMDITQLVHWAHGRFSNAAAFVLRVLAEERRDEWGEVRRRDPVGFSLILQQAFAGAGGKWRIYFWRQTESVSRLDVLTPEVWRSYEEPADITRYLPTPSVEWMLESV
jgi:hypothetical protein